MLAGGGLRVPIVACGRPIRTTYVTAHVRVGTGGWSDTATAIVKDGSGTKGTVWWCPVPANFVDVSERGSFGGGHLPFAGRV